VVDAHYWKVVLLAQLLCNLDTNIQTRNKTLCEPLDECACMMRLLLPGPDVTAIAEIALQGCRLLSRAA
jgi:hypothetical protein